MVVYHNMLNAQCATCQHLLITVTQLCIISTCYADAIEALYICRTLRAGQLIFMREVRSPNLHWLAGLQVHWYRSRDTHRVHTSLSSGLVTPSDPSGCDENSLLYGTTPVANKPHGKMAVKCERLQLDGITQIMCMCRSVLYMLSPCASLYYHIIPLCRTVLYRL
jgi:hypothetical protein